jgi:hypothetical protein
MKCLARDRSARWADCDAFGRALAQEEFVEPERFEAAAYWRPYSFTLPRSQWLCWTQSKAPTVPIELLGKITPLLAAIVVAGTIAGIVSPAATRVHSSPDLPDHLQRADDVVGLVSGRAAQARECVASTTEQRSAHCAPG